MISITNFTQLIMPDVVGCPTKLIEMVVQNVIFKFCTDAWVLQRGTGAVISGVDDTMNNEASIDLSSLSDDSLIPVGIVQMLINDEDVTLSRLQSLTHSDLLAEEDTLKYYYFDGDDSYNLVIYPVADEDTIYMVLAVSPTLAATSVDSTLYDTWCDAIVSGAKYHLFRMPNKVWTDLTSSLLMQKEYNRFVVDARRKVRKAFAKQDLSVNPRSDEIWF